METEKYKKELEKMTDEELQKACENQIWLSAYASNNPHAPAHWKVDLCYDECQRRKKPEIYKRGYNIAEASAK